MGNVLLHFVVGTLGSLLVFLLTTRLSGVSRFSLPLGVVFIGIVCASLAHFVSAWATPAVILAYAMVSAAEVRRERAGDQRSGRADDNPK
jgi:hypothetical protein